MPQLVKGGKYVFGISLVKEGFKIQVPLEAYQEYELYKSNKIILFPGSKTSGGFGINSPLRLMNSQLSGLIDLIGFDAKTGEFSTKEFTITKMGNRILSWTYISEKGVFRLNPELAGIFGLTVSHRMVVVRGGSIGPGFIAKGPIHNLAMKHPELQIY